MLDLVKLLHNSIYSTLNVVNVFDSPYVCPDPSAPLIDYGLRDETEPLQKLGPGSKLQPLPYYDLTHRLRLQYSMATEAAEAAKKELQAVLEQAGAWERKCKLLEDKDNTHQAQVDHAAAQIDELEKDNERWFARYKEANNDKYDAERTVKLYGQEREMLITENDMLAGKLEEIDPESKATQLCLAQAFRTGSYVFENDLDLNLDRARAGQTPAEQLPGAGGGRGRRRLSIAVTYANDGSVEQSPGAFLRGASSVAAASTGAAIGSGGGPNHFPSAVSPGLSSVGGSVHGSVQLTPLPTAASHPGSATPSSGLNRPQQQSPRT